MNKCPRCGENNPAEIHTCTPQSKAQRLASILEQRGQTYDESEVAAELRRLDALNAELVGILEFVKRGLDNGSIKSKAILDFLNASDDEVPIISLNSMVHAALAKAKEQTNE